MRLQIIVNKTIAGMMQPARRIPLALGGIVEAKLDSFLSQGIIKPMGCDSEWVSLLVIVIKDNVDLRLCVDR